MASINQNLIAEQLKISRTTVSRSLANHPAISTETREKVMRAAEALGYKPSPGRAARRHQKGSRGLTIGVLVGIPAENVIVATATFPYILKGIRDRAEVEGVTVDINYQPPGELQPESSRPAVFRHIRNGDWRGVILIHPFAEAAVEMISRKISTVAVLESYSHPSIDIIDTDDAPAIGTLMENLRNAGHRRIGFLSWEYQVGGHWVTRRFGAYVEALFFNDLEFNPNWVLNVRRNQKMTPAQVADAVAESVRSQGVTAWVCAADHQAYRLMQDLAERGLKVPEDCSITGFDGLDPEAGKRRVTSMRVPYEHIGASALSRVVSRIAHPSSPRRKILVEAQFIAGETIAAPRTH